MKFFYRLLLLNALSLIFGCSSRTPEMLAIDQTLNTHVKFYKKRGFHCYCTGAAFPKELQWLHVDYSLERQCNVEEARSLIVPMAHLLKDLINKEQRLRKFLTVYPCGIDTVEVGIQFNRKNSNKYIQAPYIAYAMATHSEITYYKYDCETEDLVEIYSEKFPL